MFLEHLKVLIPKKQVILKKNPDFCRLFDLLALPDPTDLISAGRLKALTKENWSTSVETPHHCKSARTCLEPLRCQKIQDFSKDMRKTCEKWSNRGNHWLPELRTHWLEVFLSHRASNSRRCSGRPGRKMSARDCQ